MHQASVVGYSVIWVYNKEKRSMISRTYAFIGQNVEGCLKDLIDRLLGCIRTL